MPVTHITITVVADGDVYRWSLIETRFNQEIASGYERSFRKAHSRAVWFATVHWPGIPMAETS